MKALGFHGKKPNPQEPTHRGTQSPWHQQHTPAASREEARGRKAARAAGVSGDAGREEAAWICLFLERAAPGNALHAEAAPGSARTAAGQLSVQPSTESKRSISNLRGGSEASSPIWKRPEAPQRPGYSSLPSAPSPRKPRAEVRPYLAAHAGGAHRQLCSSSCRRTAARRRWEIRELRGEAAAFSGKDPAAPHRPRSPGPPRTDPRIAAAAGCGRAGREDPQPPGLLRPPPSIPRPLHGSGMRRARAPRGCNGGSNADPRPTPRPPPRSAAPTPGPTAPPVPPPPLRVLPSLPRPVPRSQVAGRQRDEAGPPSPRCPQQPGPDAPHPGRAAPHRQRLARTYLRRSTSLEVGTFRPPPPPLAERGACARPIGPRRVNQLRGGGAGR